MNNQNGINKSTVKQTNYKAILGEIFEEYAKNLSALMLGAPGAYVVVLLLVGAAGATICFLTGLLALATAITIGLALIPIAAIFSAYGLVAALIIAAAAIVAAIIAVACSIIPSLYIITNLCFMSYFAASTVSLTGTIALSWQILGIIGLSLALTNLLIDLIL